MIRTVVVLTVVAMFSAALLSYVHHLTKDSIERNRATHARQQLRDLLPSVDESELCDAGFRIIEVDSRGYGGPVKVAVVYENDELSGVRVMSHTETPGYSDILNPDQWIGQFGNKPNEEIDAVTRATITSKAVLRVVEEANRLITSEPLSCLSN